MTNRETTAIVGAIVFAVLIVSAFGYELGKGMQIWP